MDFLTFFTFLTALLGFVATPAANPLQAREDNRATAIPVSSTMPASVSVLPAGAIPSGYTFGKILYNTTLHGRNHQFVGHGMDEVYTQVKTQYPDFNPQNAIWNKLLYPDVAPDNNKDDAPPVSANHTHSKGIENRMVGGGIVQGGTGTYSAFLSLGWGGGAKSQDSHLALWHYQGDYNVVTIPARWCGMFSCWVNAGWTICNGNPFAIMTTVDNFARWGLELLWDWPQGPNCCFWGWDDQTRCGGQIFNEPQDFNMILREGFGCGVSSVPL